MSLQMKAPKQERFIYATPKRAIKLHKHKKSLWQDQFYCKDSLNILLQKIQIKTYFLLYITHIYMMSGRNTIAKPLL